MRAFGTRVDHVRRSGGGRLISVRERLLGALGVAGLLGAVLGGTVFAAAVKGAGTVSAASAAAAAPATQDWPTFLHDPARSSASADGILNVGNAPTLAKKWTYTTGGFVAASPTVVGGIVYVGSWDGNEYALNGGTGALVWKTALGTTFDPPCVPPHLGVTSAATVTNGVVYVGGGDSYWYALNAGTGAVLWRVFTGDNSQAGAHYNWSSPLIIGNFGYIGIASNCDAPLVQGEVLRVDLTSHQVVGTAKMVSDGQVGGGVWTSPTYDAATNTIFVSTGTLNLYSQTMSQAIVSFDATTMAIKDHWQLPFEAAVSDSDWGTTPTLTTDSLGRQLVSVVNKNGIVYTLARNNLAAGPVWQRVIAIGGDCPPCGDGSIASAAFANGTLYQAGGSNVAAGTGHGGSVSALNPGTGALTWYHPTNEPVIGSIAYDNGLILVPQGGTLEVLDATNGHSLWTYRIGAPTYAAPSVSNGIVYFGGLDNMVHAFGLPATPPPAPPADAGCPAGFTCQDIGPSHTPGSEKVQPDGSFNVSGTGQGTRGAVDQYRSVSLPASGDFQVSVKVSSATGGNYGNGFITPQVGLMLRQSAADVNSPYYTSFIDPRYPAEAETQPNMIEFDRDAWGPGYTELTQTYPTPFPRWIMIQRHGDVFQTLTSGDGVNYVLLSGTVHKTVMPWSVQATLFVSSGDTSTMATANFADFKVAAPGGTFARQASTHPCPATWSCEDVGAGAPIGDQTLNGGTWTVYGEAPGISATTDQFHYVYRALPGDGTVTGRLTSLGKSSPAAQAGLVMRADDSPGARYYAIIVHPDGSAVVQWRVESNLWTRLNVALPAQTLPRWYQIQRYTDTAHAPVQTYYTSLTSTDGATWTQVAGSTVALSLGAAPLAGLAGSSNDPAGRATNPATWDNVSTSAASVPAPGICPANWTCQDVGVGFVPGSQTALNGTWTVSGGGADIWDVYDQFRMISQPMAADGTISARVVSVGSNPQGYQKAGVMLRTSADPQAPYYAVFQSPAHGILVQWRTAQAGLTNQIAIPGPSPAYPVYVMAGRWTDPVAGGTYYTAYTSTDNRTFTAVPGSTIALTMPGTLRAGIAADSYDQKVTFQSTFDNVALFNNEPAPPGACPYTSFAGCADIGGATPAGSQTYTSGSLTEQVGGGDIWSTADQLHLVWQSLAADGSVSARVVTQQNAGPWAKAGVMLRATTAAGSPYYGMFVTPSNGMVVQYRTTPGATTQGIFFAGTAPAYVKVSKFTDGAGTVFYTAYSSTDGVTWTAVTGSTVSFPMTAPLLAAYGADAYSQAVTSTVTMDTLQVSTATAPPQGGCVAPWTCADVGGATPSGAQNIVGANITVTGGGGDIWGTGDQFRLVAQPLAADGTVTAQITSQQAVDPWSKAGVMMRATTDPGSPYFGVLMTPANGLVVQWRTVQGGTSSQVRIAGALPLYVRVARWTDTATGITEYSAYSSADGATWALVPGSTTVLTMPGTLSVGLAATSHNTTQLSKVQYAAVAVGTTSSKPPG